MNEMIVTAAVTAAFFMAPAIGNAEDHSAAPSVLVKETQPGLKLKDFPWNLPEGRTNDVSIPVGALVLTMPWMDVEKNGADFVTINAPKLVVSNDSDIDVYDGPTLTDIEVLVRRSGEAMVTSGIAKTIRSASIREDGPQVAMDGFEFDLTSRGHELVIAAAENDAKFDSDETQSALRALNFALDYAVASSRITVADARNDELPFDLILSSGPSVSSIIFGDGRMDLSAQVNKSEFQANGPLPVQGDIGVISYQVSMPMEASDAAQQMQFGFELSDVTLSDTIWRLFDPQEVFPRAFERVKIDAALDVILKDSIFDGAGRAANRETIEPVATRIKALEIDGLGLDVSGNADVEIANELPKDVTAYLSVTGLSQFMANVVKAGFVPQSQAILAEGIALQFSEEQADGSLSFDVKTQNGIVTINGNRVAPLPR